MTWLQCTTPHPEAEQRLICFPHAGGTASFYASWGPLFSRTEVHAVCYPGRAQRATEPFATDLRRLAQHIARAAHRLADRPLVLFGHSMGAWVAFETARQLEKDGVPVAHLFVSGARGPHTLKGALTRPTPRDDTSIIEEITALGGVARELRADPDLLKRVFPYIIADVQMIDSHAHRPGPPLNCPLTTVVAVDDPVVSAQEAEAWSRQTRDAWHGRTVPGDHFYLAAEPPVALVEGALASAAPPRTRT